MGISFYTFQALGYMIDVYRGKLPPERSLMRYALFVSFFPQLVAGPIERSENLLRQVNEDHPLDEKAVRDGLLVMLLGFFESWSSPTGRACMSMRYTATGSRPPGCKFCWRRPPLPFRFTAISAGTATSPSARRRCWATT